MNKLKITYWVSTSILTIIMLFSAGNYLFNNTFVQEIYTELGYPTHIIYPLAIAKLLGLSALYFAKNKTLIEWAYAGFTYNTLLGLLAHLSIGDGQYPGALIALIATITSYTTRKKLATKR